MEYLLIVPLTFIVSWYIIIYSGRLKMKSGGHQVRTQSYIHYMIKDLIPSAMFKKPEMITQSRKYSQKNLLQVIISDGKAYWTKNNVFYIADTVDGRIVQDSIKPLDTENLSKKELDKLLDILDTLKKGKTDDSGSSRN